jgi:LysR family hydrogen peroxide-inducible transcriptional activator
MAVPVETRSARVSIARFPAPSPSRTIGMIWRNATPLARQLRQIADVIHECTRPIRERATGGTGQP